MTEVTTFLAVWLVFSVVVGLVVGRIIKEEEARRDR
jgi:hypothetical protein